MPDLLSNLAEVAGTFRWNHEKLLALFLDVLDSNFHLCRSSFREQIHQHAKKLIRARIVELRGDGSNNGKLLVICIPQIMVALELLSHVADGIQGSALVKFVDGDYVGKIQHVDFLQLRRGPKFRRHDVQRHIAVVHDFRIALANSTGFEHNQIKS